MSPAAITWCALCTSARCGQYMMTRPCCRARWLAQAPRHVRQAAYRRLAAIDGRDAALAMVAWVNAWHRRQHHGSR